MLCSMFRGDIEGEKRIKEGISRSEFFTEHVSILVKYYILQKFFCF